MKRIAIPVFWHQVATVLDYAGTFLLVALDGDSVRGRLEVPRDRGEPEEILGILEAFDVDLVICGAASRSLLDSLHARGIPAITCVRGPVESVIRAYLRDTLAAPEFRLPGAACDQRPDADTLQDRRTL